MDKTGYLIFEIGTECNLGHLHVKCPNQHPDRYKHVDTSQAMSDDTIVDTAVAMIQEHGFRGLVGFHYYNEPCLQQDRMLSLVLRIRAREESAKFVLWTNGTVRLSAARINEFDDIHITDYGLDSHPCKTVTIKTMSCSFAVHRWPLDDRLTTTGAEPNRPESDSPCCRMFTEMIFDYYGNVHLCCYDWRGLGSVGNIHTADHDSDNVGGTELLRRARTRHALRNLLVAWRQVRDAMIGRAMSGFMSVATVRHDRTWSHYGVSPQVCRTCTAPGRNVGITDFVKAPAEAARAYRQEVLNRGP